MNIHCIISNYICSVFFCVFILIHDKNIHGIVVLQSAVVHDENTMVLPSHTLRPAKFMWKMYTTMSFAHYLICVFWECVMMF